MKANEDSISGLFKVIIVTEIILVALKVLCIAKKIHPKLFATFRFMLAEALIPPIERSLK